MRVCHICNEYPRAAHGGNEHPSDSGIASCNLYDQNDNFEFFFNRKISTSSSLKMLISKSNAYDCLIPLMKAKGVTMSASDFHHTVNLCYHRFEADIYDYAHQEMWDSLPIQFELLTSDVLKHALVMPNNIKMLDIGCGTGLSSALLLGTELGQRVTQIDLLDTAPEMLQKCRERATSWNVKHQIELGTLEKAPATQYDLILVSSVLHHIPDLAAFLQQITALQTKGGIFLHINDPNGDYLQDTELLSRQQHSKSDEINGWQKWANRALAPLRFLKRKCGKLIGRTPQRPKAFSSVVNDELLRTGGNWSLSEISRVLATAVNDELLRTGVIREPMLNDELWSVTDIHVDGLPFSSGAGISIRQFKEWLPDYQLISTRSYAFFGKLWSRLPDDLKSQEMDLIQKHALNGHTIAAVWQRRE